MTAAQLAAVMVAVALVAIALDHLVRRGRR